MLKTQCLIVEITYGLFEDQRGFEEIFDMLRADFEFRGCLGGVVIGSEGESLYQDAHFVHRS